MPIRARQRTRRLNDKGVLRGLFAEGSDDFRMSEIQGSLVVIQPFAQNGSVRFVFETLEQLGVRRRHESRQGLSRVREQDPLVTVGNTLDVCGKVAPSVGHANFNHVSETLCPMITTI